MEFYSILRAKHQSSRFESGLAFVGDYGSLLADAIGEDTSAQWETACWNYV